MKNSIILEGNLLDNPIRTEIDGEGCVCFRLACEREKEAGTDVFRAVVYGALAAEIEQKCRTGQTITVWGRLRRRGFIHAGAQKWSVEIVATGWSGETPANGERQETYHVVPGNATVTAW